MTIDIPDLTGQVALVTGGNSGIGDICVRRMAQAGARVFLLARSADKAQAAIAALRAADVAAAGRVEHIQCDLASLASVKQAAADVAAKTDRLDVCLNNAGVMAMPYTFTEDGIEMQIGTNVVGHYLLTLLLLPLLVKTSLLPEHAERSVRIVHVSSMGHQSPLSTKDWSSLEKVNQRGGRVEATATWYRYGTSKTGNIQLANRFSALLKSLGAEHVYNLSLHPGVIKTNLTQGPVQSYGAVAGRAISFMTRFITSPEDGARTSLYAATSAEVDAKKLDAAYLVPTAKLGKASAYARDEQKGDEVMAFCASFVKEKVGVDAEAIKQEVKQILAAAK